MTDGLDEQQHAVLRVLLAMQRQSWEQGVLSHALLDLGLDDAAEAVARDAVVRQTATGKLGEVDDVGIVNCGALGEVVGWAARRTGDPALQTALERQLEWLLQDAPRAADGTLFHIEGTREVWVDSVYMTVPLLVSVGRADAARTQFEGHRDRLWDAGSGLYGWRWDEDLARVSHPRHWGTGAGWVVAAVARAMRSGMADDRDLAAEATLHARTVIDGVLAAAQAAGGYYDVLDDPSTFPEGNARQMVAYAMLAGVRDGWLPHSYRSVGLELVAEARQQVDAAGFVIGVCGAPNFDHPGTSAEAQAFFLLATNEAA